MRFFLFFRTGVIPPPYIISAIKSCHLQKKGCKWSLYSILDTKDTGLKLENIRVVKEFVDVFLDELLNALIERE